MTEIFSVARTKPRKVSFYHMISSNGVNSVGASIKNKRDEFSTEIRKKNRYYLSTVWNSERS